MFECLNSFTYGHKKTTHRFQNDVRVANAVAMKHLLHIQVTFLPISTTRIHLVYAGYLFARLTDSDRQAESE